MKLPIKHILVLAVVILVTCRPTWAETQMRTKELLIDDGIVALVETNKEIVDGGAGRVHFPDRLFGQVLDDALKDDAFVKQYRKIYSFYAVEFTISIDPSTRYSPERVRISGSVPGGEAIERRVVVRDVFPRTKLAAPDVSADGSVEIGAGATFGLPGTTGASPGSAEAKVGLKLAFKYAPVFAELASGYGGSSFFWQFVRTQSTIPVGAIPLKLILMVPRTIRKLNTTIDVTVDLSNRWWEPNKQAQATIRIPVDLP